MKGQPHDTREKRQRKRIQGERDAARTARDLARMTKIHAGLRLRPASAARDELLTLVDRELAMLRDPAYQAARLEAERCMARGRQVPEWAMQFAVQGTGEGAARMIPKVTVSAAERRERRRLRSQRRLEKMLALMDKPGADRVFPDVEAVKAKFREQLAVVSDPKAYCESLPGGRPRGGEGGKSGSGSV
jgi:hypothetical protein